MIMTIADELNEKISQMTDTIEKINFVESHSHLMKFDSEDDIYYQVEFKDDSELKIKK